MKRYFAYIRVSTTRQGEGVSLQQQTDAIKQFAARSNLEIVEWLEEQETAAKAGRPVFNSMIKRLRKGLTSGVIMHKIDRSARNLKDWAELGQLIDQGIEVHFANESLDLNSRGGRLSADIQAVVAADYIRNLREETKKGFYGRLKQGYFPMPAPIGYEDQGGGKAKAIHPVYGPLVHTAFDLYATGRYSLNSLTAELAKMGLRSRSGNRVSRNGVHRMLRNPFYIGLIRVHKINEVFTGLHPRLIPKVVFDRVQDILAGKRVRGTGTHRFQYSRLIQCKTCGHSLIADIKRRHTYYRCHSPTCPTTIIREETIEKELLSVIQSLTLTSQELATLDLEVEHKRAGIQDGLSAEREVLNLHLKVVTDRQNRLTDAYVDGALNREDFEQRKTALQMERFDIEERIRTVESGESLVMADIDHWVRLIKEASLFTQTLRLDELRDWLEEAMSHREASRKDVVFTLRKPLAEVSLRATGPNGRPSETTCPSFWRQWLERHRKADRDGVRAGR